VLMTQRTWLILCLGSLFCLIVLGAGVSVLEARYAEPPPGAQLLLGVPMIALILCLVVSLPPLFVPAFIEAQVRVGNGALPWVAFMASNPQRIVRAIWLVWGIGAVIALPWAIWDWTHDPDLLR